MAVVLAVPGSHGLVLALEFALAAWCNRREPAPKTGVRTWLAAWWHEWLLASRVFGWRQPFRSRSIADHLPEKSAAAAPSAIFGARRGVLLVHGYLCNRGMWNPWMARLRRMDVPFVAVSLEPVFGSIDGYAAPIEAAVQRLFAATGQPVLVVAHSMGGLAVRAWLDVQRGRPAASAAGATADSGEPWRRVRHVVTIGSPHRGTVLARFGRSPSARQMRRDGDWHVRLAGREPADQAARFTCFYGACDNVVFPASTAALPGADNRLLHGSGHLQMIERPEPFDELTRWLTADAVAPPPLSPPSATVRPR